MADKKRVMLVDCVSTSLNFIKDIQDAKMTAVVLELPWIKKFNPLHYNYTAFGGKQPEIVKADRAYAKTLAKVKKAKPIAIIPCTDNAIEWALRLSKDLHLPSSDYANYHKMRDKHECQKALAEHGVRSIETIEYSNMKEALKFFNTHDKEVIVKPASGTSSINVFVCRNEKQFRHAIKLCLEPGEGLTSGKILIQEFIKGTEYVVNTCSCNGVATVTSVWKYFKKEVPGFAPIYLNLRFIKKSDPEIKRLLAYNAVVLKAIGIKYGLCHNEFKCDAKGPVLIEANCRAPGGSMQGKYLDSVLGHHETNVSLWAYTNPKKFAHFAKTYKGCISHGILKFLVIDKRIYVKKDNFAECFKDVPSYHYSNFGALFHAKEQWLDKTIDYHTTGGVIFLQNNNKKQLEKDYEHIVYMEKNHIDKLFKIGKPSKK